MMSYVPLHEYFYSSYKCLYETSVYFNQSKWELMYFQLSPAKSLSLLTENCFQI